MEKGKRLNMEIKRLTPSKLLGRPLNEVEKKYAPRVLYIAGSMKVPLPGPRVAVIGTRNPSPEGLEDTAEITKILVKHGIIIVSGLARGIDTTAHKTAVDCGGKTIAVLGTPLNKFYPPENRPLQELIMKEHLAVSQYPIGHITRPRDFILRNRTMALLSDASIIVEAGKTSGVISQGWETLRLGRPLFLWKLLLNRNLEWVEKMIKYGAIVLKDIDDLHYVIRELFPPLEGIVQVEEVEIEEVKVS
jgi:DNA processing protein